MKATAAIRNIPMMARVVAANPRLLLVRPSLTGFMCGYMNKFRVRKVGGKMILHSHLPPLNSRAYSRFVDTHLIAKSRGPSHAQIGVTNQCPQNCDYCYNKNRAGRVMDSETIIRVARELRDMGVVWLGLTGGEPLMNKDLVRIIASVSEDCAVKLFTTGCTLTPRLAAELRDAGLFSVSVSLDHWEEGVHDGRRRFEGAFRAALNAIDVFLGTGDVDVGVSAVLTPEMIRGADTERFLEFLRGLGIHEAWLSELKPSIEEFWDDRLVITEADRRKLVEMQDRYNLGRGMTVNYLGHFEGREHFGCNAGHKMIYVDAFGEVSPCVFTPMGFGNIHDKSVAEIFDEMRGRFPSDAVCFINKNYRLIEKRTDGRSSLTRKQSIEVMNEVDFAGLSAFFRLYYSDGGSEGRLFKTKASAGTGLTP